METDRRSKQTNVNGLKMETKKTIQDTDGSKPVEQKLRLKHAIILPILVLIFLSISIMSYIMIEWTQYRIRNELFPNASDVKHFSGCNVTNQSDPIYHAYRNVQQRTASWSMYFSISLNIPTFVSNLILPTYTDTYGRRFLFILSVGGLFIKCIVVTIVVFLNGQFIYIVVASVVEGMTGASYALLCTIFSYVADITVTDNYRVLGILLMEAILMLTGTVSGALTGIMVESPTLGYEYTSLIGTAMMGSGFIMTALFLPETLEKCKNVPKPKSVFSTLKKTVEFYFSKEFRGMRAKYIILLLSFFFTIQSLMHRSTLETMYLLGQPFCWGPLEIGYFSVAQRIGSGLIGLASVKLLQKCASNEVIAIISTISIIVSLVIEGFATTNVMIYSVAAAGIFSFIVIPMIRGMMSTITPVGKQGAVFAGLSAVEVAGSVTGSLIVNEIYSATMSIMNGFVFLVLAGISMINLCLLAANHCIKPRPAAVEDEVKDQSTTSSKL